MFPMKNVPLCCILRDRQRERETERGERRVREVDRANVDDGEIGGERKRRERGR